MPARLPPLPAKFLQFLSLKGKIELKISKKGGEFMADLIPFGDFFGDLEDMRKSMERAFSKMPHGAARFGKGFEKGGWYPAVDMEETENEIIVKAELPGINQEDIKIEAGPDSVSLAGQRKEYHEIEDKKAGYIRKERSFGQFSRTLPLPSRVDPDKAEANFESGVLEIKLPKIGKRPKGKRIDIKKK
jgi:HSP20 family protein